jgi:hypothetical protein
VARLQRLERTNEVLDPKGVMSVSREIGCVCAWKRPWGADGEVSMRPSREKRERGWALGRPSGRCGRQETLEGDKPKGASNGGSWLNPGSPVGIPGGVPSPVGEAGRRGDRANSRRVAASERTYGTVRGSKAPKG